MGNRPKIFDGYPDTLLQAAAMHSLLYTLGFDLKKDVTMLFSPDDVGVVLEAQGKKGMLRMGAPELEPAEMGRLWERLATAWQSNSGDISEADKDALYRTSKACQYKIEIISSLTLQGFDLSVRK